MAAMVYVDGNTFLITTIQVNYVLTLGEAGVRQHKLASIVVIKLPSSYTVTAIS